MSLRGVPLARRHLREVVNLSQIVHQAGAPAWLQRISGLATNESAALALAAPGRIGFKAGGEVTRRVSSDNAVIYLAGVAAQVRRAKLRVAVALPPGCRDLPLILATACVLADTVDGTPRGRARPVLIVSSDSETRSVYPDILIGGESLQREHPGSRVGRDGRLVPLKASARDGSSGVCFFLPWGPPPIRLGGEPDLIILDLRLRSNTAEDLVPWIERVAPKAGVVALHFLDDLTAEGHLRNGSYQQLPLDEIALQGCDEVSGSPGRASSADWSLDQPKDRLNRDHVLQFLHAEAFEAAIVEASELLRQHREEDNLDLRRARWALAVLRTLPTPVDYYEEAAHASGRWTLSKSISRIGSLEAGGLGLSQPVAQSLRMLLDHAYQLLSNSNARVAALESLLSRRPDEQSCVVIVRDEIVAKALRSWLVFTLNGKAHGGKLPEVAALSRFASAPPMAGDVAILNGPLPTRYEWALHAPLAGVVKWLTYEPEADVVYRQLEGLYSRETAGIRARARERTMERLAPSTRIAPAGPDPEPPKLRVSPPHDSLQRSQTDKAPTTVLRGGLEGLAAALAAAQTAREEALLQSQARRLAWAEKEDMADADLEVDQEVDEALAVVLQVSIDGGKPQRLVLSADAVLDVVRIGPAPALVRSAASEVQVGDVVLLTDKGARVSLFEEIVAIAERQQSTAHLGRYRSAWRDAVGLLGRTFRDGKGTDYTAVLAALRREGATVSTEASVRAWIAERVIGPETRESLVAVGRVSGQQALVLEAASFDAAFWKIRRLHQIVGRRLAESLRRSASAVAPTTTRELDDELAIPVDELVEAVRKAEVLSVSATGGGVDDSGD